jgi:hypothetical protein
MSSGRAERHAARPPSPIRVAMSERSYRRLTRYAALSALHLLLVVSLMIARVPGAEAALIVFVASPVLLLAWGPFQADIELNSELDVLERGRWRVAMWLLPWAAALYWLRHVRPRRLSG